MFEKMIKAIIVDDEQKAQQMLLDELKKSCPEVEVLTISDSIADAFKKISQLKPDLVFLDIDLGKNNSFELLDLFDEINFNIVFVTGFNDFAIKAFKYSAIDYILKPVNSVELIKAVSKVKKEKIPQIHYEHLIKQVKEKEISKNIILNSAGKSHIVDINNIMHCMVVNNYVTFFIYSGNEITITKQLKDVEELLPENLFLKPHRAHLVNYQYIDFIDHLNDSIVLKDGTTIPISSKRKDFIVKMFKNK